MSRVAYTRPSITDLEVEYATDAARNGWGAQCYDYIHRLEAGFAAHRGVPHAIATSSCTGAMHMGPAALGIGPGDEVILADTNWIATAAPVVHVEDAETLEALKSVAFEDVCITSAISLTADPSPAAAFRLPDVPGLGVVFERAQGEKCQRCWKILPDVGTHSHAATCARCDEALA